MSIVKIQNFSIGRREMLLATGSSAALLILGAHPGLAVESGAPVPAMASEQRFNGQQFNIRYVVTDRRLPESVTFGQAHASNGAVRLEVTDSLTKLWQEALLPLWRERGGAVAGLTTREVWHCLAEQARSQSHRTVMLQQLDTATNQPYPLVSWVIA